MQCNKVTEQSHGRAWALTQVGVALKPFLDATSLEDSELLSPLTTCSLLAPHCDP